MKDVLGGHEHHRRVDQVNRAAVNIFELKTRFVRPSRDQGHAGT